MLGIGMIALIKKANIKYLFLRAYLLSEIIDSKINAGAK
jgi:hypothetical protein